MTESLQKLVAALREELKHYGELLALLDQQQELVVARAPDELYRSIGAIQLQTERLQAARTHREACRESVATVLGRPHATEFADLIPALPSDYQPLVQALVRENNHLLIRLQQRARQNHLLLSRSLELMQTFMNSLFPNRETQVYNGLGSRRSAPPATPALFQAVG